MFGICRRDCTTYVDALKMAFYTPIVVFMLVAAGFLFFMWFLRRIWAGRRVLYSTPYECGEVGTRLVGRPFDLSYYMVALLLLLFEIEVLFVFPWAISWSLWSKEMLLWGLVEGGVFMGLLFLGLMYVLKKGVLWERFTFSQLPVLQKEKEAKYEEINERYA